MTAKEQLLSQNVLTHYDPWLCIRLACDASPYGVGAVISHVLPNGEERPVAFTSRKLSKAEQNYAQIKREALSIVNSISTSTDAVLSSLLITAPSPPSSAHTVDAIDVFRVEQLETLPVSSADIRKDTLADPRLSEVMEMEATGHFPDDTDMNGTPHVTIPHQEKLAHHSARVPHVGYPGDCPAKAAPSCAG
ncbi:hypothetical protein SKAU_G00217520 [Synaphobranchus kaupii]|uniref:Reverse transcriptase/retrotransposon-derived protein RNase H-like domain-containing protein n=1 Tax=Synaphobranchus kaupii TaxID=118154 RepID=A0A9Q1FAB7_SYNKA|nr:hypothetical protein SKAU_G00217520 [Synaphobranchus kaupii]